MALPSPEEIDQMMAAEAGGVISAPTAGLPSPDEIQAMMDAESRPTWGQSARFVGKSFLEGGAETVDLLTTLLAGAGREPQTGAQDLVHWIVGSPDDEGLAGPVAKYAKAAIKGVAFPVGGPVPNALISMGSQAGADLAPEHPVMGSILGGLTSAVGLEGLAQSGKLLTQAGKSFDRASVGVKLRDYVKSLRNRGVIEDAETGQLGTRIGQAIDEIAETEGLGFLRDPDRMAARNQTALKTLGTKIGTTLEQADTLGAKTAVDFQGSDSAVASLLGKAKAEKADIKAAFSQFLERFNDPTDGWDGTIQSLNAWKSSLGNLAFGGTAQGSLRPAVARRLQRAIYSDLSKAVDQGVVSSGAANPSEWANVMRAYSNHSELLPVLNHELAAGLSSTWDKVARGLLRTSGGTLTTPVLIASAGGGALGGPLAGLLAGSALATMSSPTVQGVLGKALKGAGRATNRVLSPTQLGLMENLAARSGAVSSGAAGGSLKSSPKFSKLPRLTAGLTEEQLALQETAISTLQKNPEGLVKQYLAKNYDPKSGNIVLDTDLARPLVLPDSAPAVSSHEAASALVKAAAEEVISDPKFPNVAIISGPPGAGKSTARSQLKNTAVWDKIIKSPEQGSELIESMLAQGKEPEFHFVYTDPVATVKRAWGRALKEGRAVPLTNFATNGIDTAQAAVNIADKYIGDPARSVGFAFYDNSGSQLKYMSLENLRKIAYNNSREGVESIHNRLSRILRDEYEQTRAKAPEAQKARIDKLYSEFTAEGSGVTEQQRRAGGPNGQNGGGDIRSPERSGPESSSKYPVIDVPLSRIKLSDDVKQWKSGSDAKGVVSPIGGEYERRGLGIQLWERENGDLEVISGRHKFDLAKRNNESTVPAQIYKESEGFTLKDAKTLDAEINIKKGQGSVKDYSKFFRESEMSLEDATQKGLIARPKGKTGFTIGKDGSSDLYAAHQAGEITDKEALTIVQAAPGNADLQRAGLTLAKEGVSLDEIPGAIDEIKGIADKLPPSEQIGMFGDDDRVILAAVQQSKAAESFKKDLQTQISTVKNAAKNPDIAAKFGVDVKDPDGILKKVGELQEEKARWSQWRNFDDLREKVHKAVTTAGKKTKASALLGGSGSLLLEDKRLSIFDVKQRKEDQMEPAAFEKLKAAVIKQESGGKASAVSHKGAVGLMQIMPETAKDIAKELGVEKYDLKDPKTNEIFGTYYLEKMLDKFKDPKLALAAYNAGPGAVQKWINRWGRNWDDISRGLENKGAYLETVRYVPAIMKRTGLIET